MFSVHDYLRPLYRRRWLAGTAFLITVALAFVYAFTATPVYRATARLLIEPQDPNVVTFQEVIVERGLFSMNAQTTQRDMVRSRSLARTVIDRLDLWDHPEFGGPREETAAARLLRTINPIRLTRLAFSWLRSAILPASAPSPAEGFADAETRAESRAITALLARLEVVAGRQSQILTLRFSAFEPKLAADVVNALAELHVERDMEFRYTTSRNASRWLEQRIAEQRQKLAASERALQSYREQHGAAGIADRQNIIIRELENLHAAATAATLSRVESEARYRDLQDAQGDAEALGRFPEILRNEVIQEQRLIVASLRRDRARLAEELGPRHPDMMAVESSLGDAEARLQNEVLAVVDSLRIEFEVAGSRERQLLDELDRQTQNALALDRTGIEYGVMRREAESDRNLYESLLQRAAETGVTGELETSNVRVLDVAEVPIRPARPRRQLVILLGLLGGGILGVGLVFGMEFVDDRIRTPDDLRTYLEAAYLGMVPLVKGEDQDDRNDDSGRVPAGESTSRDPAFRGRPGRFRRGDPIRSHQPHLLVGRRGVPGGCGNQRRARRGQELHLGEPRRLPGPTGEAYAAGRCRPPASATALVLRKGPRTRFVEPAGGRHRGNRRRERDVRFGTLAGHRREDPSECGRPRRLRTIRPVPRFVPRPFRLDRHRHDADPPGRGRAPDRADRGERALRRRQRSDVAPGRCRRARKDRPDGGPRTRRGAQQGRVGAPPLLLLALLPPRIQPLLQSVTGDLTPARPREVRGPAQRAGRDRRPRNQPRTVPSMPSVRRA